MFFRKGKPTEEVWIYDLRTNVDKVTKRHPLTDQYFKDFENCYQSEPRVETSRFKKFSIDDIEERDFNLDIIWLRDDSLENPDDLPEPEDIVAETITKLESALSSLNDLALKLSNNNSNGDSH